MSVWHHTLPSVCVCLSHTHTCAGGVTGFRSGEHSSECHQHIHTHTCTHVQTTLILQGIQPARTHLSSTPLQWVYCCFCQFNLPSICALSRHPSLALSSSPLLPPSSSVLQCCLLEKKKEKTPTTRACKRTSPLPYTHTQRRTWQRIWLQPITFACTCSFIHALVNKGLSPTYSTHEFTHPHKLVLVAVVFPCIFLSCLCFSTEP